MSRQHKKKPPKGEITGFQRFMIAAMGLGILSPVLAAFLHRDSSYRNWWGGLVFAPIGLIFGLGCLAFAAFPSILGATPKRSKRHQV
jgi:hypothetical protein